MKVLLLHPEDEFTPAHRARGWDLVVDFGLAPPDTYEEWSAEAGCRVACLTDYARGFDDLDHLREIAQRGHGAVVDKHGIDWWVVVLPMLLPELEQALMLSRLAQELGPRCQLFHSRVDARSLALQRLLGVPASSLRRPPSPLFRRVGHYRDVLSRFDLNQLRQIAWDKFDPEHALRRRLAREPVKSGRPEILLPTAYINVSRTAVSYAALLPEMQFLLAAARPGGRVRPLPENVCLVSLDAFFGRTDPAEMASLLEKWDRLQGCLVASSAEFQCADSLGMFRRIEGLMCWGIAARDAWVRLFSFRNIIGCLSADDGNPYTSLPLHLAAGLGIPTAAVHHGALDYRNAVKPLCGDVYLAKGELERDYLVGKCRVPAERIVVGAPAVAASNQEESAEKSRLVFFTEPYPISGWREIEIYRGLLPNLLSLTRKLGLKLVFKLHPFESVKGQRNLLSKFLSADELGSLEIIAAPLSDGYWASVRCAMTFSSSVAVECAMRSVPIFLCGWMQMPYGGYLQQYEKFGIGHILASPSQIHDIPQLLATWKAMHVAGKEGIWRGMDPQQLRDLLTGSRHRCQPEGEVRTAS
jgi:hypothetical protein